MKRLLLFGFIALFSSFSYAQTILTLDDCCRMAVENNRQGKLSDYAIEQAKLQVKNVKSDFLPKFSASGGYLYANKAFAMELAPSLSAAVDMNNTCFAGIQLEQPIYMGGKIVTARKMSDIGMSIAHINKRKKDSDIRIETEETYWNVLRAKELHKVSLKYKDLIRELYRDMENRHRAGMVSKNELLKVQVKWNEAELSVEKSKHAVRLAQMSLCHIIGLPLTRNVDVSGTIELPSLPRQKTDFDVQSRSEYQLLVENINMKRQQIKAVRSDFLPKIGLVAGYSYLDGIKMNRHKFLQDDVFSVMLSVKIPLFHWGEGYRKIKSAKIEMKKAEILRDEMIEKMYLEVTRKSDILDEARLEVGLTEKAFSCAEENLAESKKSYETGMETLTGYLEAQADWQKTYSKLVSAKADYHIAESKYLNSLGLF